MKPITVEAYTESSNYAVVKLPGRRFPGVVVQGDSLWLLFVSAQAIRDGLKEVDRREIAEEAEELFEILRDLVEHYERVLEENGLQLPYVRSL